MCWHAHLREAPAFFLFESTTIFEPLRIPTPTFHGASILESKDREIYNLKSLLLSRDSEFNALKLALGLTRPSSQTPRLPTPRPSFKDVLNGPIQDGGCRSSIMKPRPSAKAISNPAVSVNFLEAKNKSLLLGQHRGLHTQGSHLHKEKLPQADFQHEESLLRKRSHNS